MTLAVPLNSHNNAIVFVVGPTAVGKSHWAMKKAEESGGAIVNADSVQFYKYLNVGTAKPTAEERSRVPHLLYDIVEPDMSFTAGDYRRAALKVIEENIERNTLYFVGGSGFYLQALENGMFNVKPISSEIQKHVKVLSKELSLYGELFKVDQESAMRIGRNDPYRLERALELVLSEGRTMKQIEIEFKNSNQTLGHHYPLQKIGIMCDRENLRKRVIERTEKMLKNGFIEEVEGLVKKGYGYTKVLRSVGYKEVCFYLMGIFSRIELSEAIVTGTMQLAKKQMTWFKRDPKIVWIESK